LFPAVHGELEARSGWAYRTVSIAGVRGSDIHREAFDEIAAGGPAPVADNFRQTPAESYRLLFRFYGPGCGFAGSGARAEGQAA